jgi:hypothetical protein
LICVKDRCAPDHGQLLKSKGRKKMPLDALLVSLAVVTVFVAFAVVLFWADSQTRPADLGTIASARKPRVG